MNDLSDVTADESVCHSIGNLNAFVGIDFADPNSSDFTATIVIQNGRIMGTSYGSSLSSGYHSATDFFDSLTSCLQTVVHAVDQMAQLKLSPTRTPLQESPPKGDTWADDTLLVYRGTPLLAVAIRVEHGSANQQIRQHLAKGVVAPTAVGSIRASVRERLQAADKVVETAPQPPAEPEPIMQELVWRIVLRMPPLPGLTTPKNQEKVFTGGPFDFDTIEAAFDAIGDVIEPVVRAAHANPVP